ncbi:S8 family serine peptidase [Planococcus sp. CAU13]|uniref:S8 family serine peptidase n=1 Tax=Planococcus sp. CAU13 TaxID=1541197 RepID=UPI00068F4DE1|nr:S8 family serine peptidase [Planococcus sp. CAU13]
MKKLGVIGIIFAVVFAMQPAAAAEESPKERAIVVFKENAEQGFLEEMGIEVMEYYQNVPAASILASDDTLAVLKQSDSVASIERDKVVKPAVQLTGWGPPMVQSTLSWNSGYTGKGVKIGVVDSGISPHPDLRIAGGVSVVDYTNSYHDDNGHGTHVAGIIGALDNSIGIKGVAPEADLYAIKVFSKENKGSLIDVISGIDWAITNKMDVLNLSLGTDTGSSLFHEIIKKAHQQNILIVAAAGNKGLENPDADTVEYPARYNEVIAVSAVDNQKKRGVFSAAGPAVDVAAPGVSIRSTYLNNGYREMNGTSMAAPFVTGQAALIKQAYRGLNNDQVRNILLKNALDLGVKGIDPVFGFGLLQAQPYKLPVYGKTASLNPAKSLFLEKTQLAGPERTASVQKVKVKLAGGEEVDVTNDAVWKSVNPAIATVNKGTVTFISPGTTEITVSYNNVSAKMAVTVVPAAATVAIGFTDVASDYWAYKEISEMAARKVVKGYPDFTFKPNSVVKRANTAVMLDRAMTLVPKLPYVPFADVPKSHIYFNEITAVQQAGIFDGNDIGFIPVGELTRAQMAKVLVNAFGINEPGTNPFPDAQEHWAKEFIDPLYAAGVTTGSGGTFKPERKVTRAELAVFMYRAAEWQAAQNKQ